MVDTERPTRGIENLLDRFMYRFLEFDDLASRVDTVCVLEDVQCAIRVGAERTVGVRRGG